MFSRRDFLKLSVFSLVSLYAGDIHAQDDKYYAMTTRPEDKSVFLNKEYFRKIKEFDRPFPDDVIASEWEKEKIISCCGKLFTLQRVMGYGNFNIISFDQMRYVMSRSSKVENFTKDEYDYIESLFYRDAALYGFYGEKVLLNLTDSINKKDLIKMPGTGHYLFKGHAVDVYNTIVRDMNTLILTSGVRGIVKQLFLFLNKAVQTDGNLSMASRSLAPTGYSFHGAGDFDVGIRGWGADNFTDKFATTREYVKLIDAGYMRIRYDRKNPFGVRFEPWHVKVV